MAKDLQIVAFDVPYPPNYGGAIDVYYRIRALHQLGVRVHLHAFTYRDRLAAPELGRHCERVYYYERPLAPTRLLQALPYIVTTRMDPALLERLAALPHPILFEGLHTCGYIDRPELEGHRKGIRMHNVEEQYYRNLAGLQRNPLRRWHFRREARKLARFEARVLPHAQRILPISLHDEQYYRSKGAETLLLPAFHGETEVGGEPGRGAYVLFHGNLSVSDNERAALWLLSKVLNGPAPILVVAGRNPSNRLRTACARAPQVMLAENPSQEEMDELIAQAQVNLLYTFQPDGAKIKLLRALYRGRHVVCNRLMTDGTGLQSLCTIANDPQAMRQAVADLMGKPYEAGQARRRARLLQGSYSDAAGAQALTEWALG